MLSFKLSSIFHVKINFQYIQAQYLIFSEYQLATRNRIKRDVVELSWSSRVQGVSFQRNQSDGNPGRSKTCTKRSRAVRLRVSEWLDSSIDRATACVWTKPYCIGCFYDSNPTWIVVLWTTCLNKQLTSESACWS